MKTQRKKKDKETSLLDPFKTYSLPRLGVLPVALAIAISCWHLFLYGYPQGHDWPMELTKVAEYYHAWTSGQHPPFWANNVYHGFGCPIFLFYSPLFAAMSALFYPFAGSFSSASVYVLFLFTILAASGIYLMSRESTRGVSPLLSHSASRMACYFFVLHPYLLCDKYLRNANGEFVALCLTPFLLYGILLTGRKSRTGLAVTSLSLAAIVLSHNLTALTAAGLSVFFSGFLYYKRRPALLQSGAGLLLGLGLSAFFWLPSFSQKGLLKTQDLLTGKFDFHRQFQTLGTIFSGEKFFSIGWLTLLILTGALLLMAFRKTRASNTFPLLLGSLTATILCIFLLLKESVLLWENIPLLPFYQFPWRMLGPTALVSSLLLSLTIVSTPFLSKKRALFSLEALFLVFCYMNAQPTLHQVSPIRDSIRSRLSEWLEVPSIRQGEHRVSVGDEFIPANASSNLWKEQIPGHGIFLSASDEIKVSDIQDLGWKIRFHCRLQNNIKMEIGRWAFPGWELKIDDQKRELRPTPDGALKFQIPPGAHTIDLRYHPPAIRKISVMLSVISSIILFLLLVIIPRSPRKVR